VAISTTAALETAFAKAQLVSFDKASVTTTTGRWTSLFAAASTTGAGSLSVGNTTSGVIPTDATAGCVPIRDAAGGNSLYLARAVVTASTPAWLMIYDRLWHAGSFSLTSAATTTLSGVPALTRPDSTGADTQLWLEVNATASNTAISVTASYTNSAGTSGRTATLDTTLANVNAGSMFPFRLAAGDTGVRSVQSVTVATPGTTGSANLVILRPLVEAVIDNESRPCVLDWTQLALPSVASDAALAVMALYSSGAPGVFATLTLVEG
jgi:hypothetical protein